MLGSDGSKEVSLDVNILTIIKLLFVGIIAAATMIVPGVSGSMVLLILGYYQPITRQITLFCTALVAFDMQGLIDSFLILFPFGIGVIIGILGIAKIIEIIFAKYPVHAYYAIIGLIAASPIAILVCSDFSSFSIGMLIAGIIALIVGFGIAVNLGEK